MIVQRPPQAAPAAPRFVMRNTEHHALAGRLAEAFGNARFETPEPREAILRLVYHHDQGWDMLDAEPALDPDTGLPYHLLKTPMDRMVATGSASPDHNERYGPYEGLLSSMHTYGLYCGRYGLSDKVVLNDIPPAHRARVDAMLEGELARQARLKVQLAGSPWIEPAPLMQAYKLLQFCDTLSLYFNLAPAGERGESTFPHVPLSAQADCDVHVREVEPGRYAFAPFPFRASGVKVWCEGRYLAPGEGTRFATAPVERQGFELVDGAAH